jgi:amidophosphoribosyltransferase
MSEFISHECGIALVRLKKPLAYYQEKYGTSLWGFYQLFLLMEKQHNRGQDGAGVACVKFDVPAGEPYMFRERNVEINPLDKIFQALTARYTTLVGEGTIHPEFTDTVKKNFDFCGELYLGHLRYGTSGGYNLSACHPFFRRSSWPTRNLMLAGNFNLTNTAELNNSLIAIGQHPIFATDTQAILERIGFCLDDEHEQIYRALRGEGLPGAEISRRINEEISPARVLRTAAANWDGGYSHRVRPGSQGRARGRAGLCCDHEESRHRGRGADHAGVAEDPVHLRAHLLFPGQRRRHLPRTQGARGRPFRPDLEIHRRRSRELRLQLHSQYS